MSVHSTVRTSFSTQMLYITIVEHPLKAVLIVLNTNNPVFPYPCYLSINFQFFFEAYTKSDQLKRYRKELASQLELRRKEEFNIKCNSNGLFTFHRITRFARQFDYKLLQNLSYVEAVITNGSPRSFRIFSKVSC